MFQHSTKPSWAVRAAKLLSPGCDIVVIRFTDDAEWVELVHGNDVRSRDLLEAAQMAIVRVLTLVR